LFSIHGFLRGTVSQVVGGLGLFAGLWSGLWVSRWLGSYWVGAQPAFVYLVLRWVVAALVGMAAASLLQWWGENLGKLVRSSPVGWLDRGGGFGIGALAGLFTASVAVMVALLIHQPREIPRQAAEARASEPMMATAAMACSLSAPYVPGGGWLGEKFRKAHHRALSAGYEPHRRKS
jgi:colicin V production protein